MSIILSIISLKKMYFKTKIFLDYDKFGFLTRVNASQITNNCIYNNYITYYTIILLYIIKSPLTPLNSGKNFNDRSTQCLEVSSYYYIINIINIPQIPINRSTLEYIIYYRMLITIVLNTFEFYYYKIRYIWLFPMSYFI